MPVFAQATRHGAGWLALLSAGTLAGTGVSLALPAVLGRAVDATIAGTTGTRWVLVAAALLAIRVGCDLFDTLAGGSYVAGSTALLRHRLVRHVLRLPPPDAARFGTGDLVSRVSTGAADAAQAGPAAVQALTAAIPPLGSLVLLALIDAWLAVAFLAGVGLVALVLRAFTRHTTATLTRYQTVQGELATRLSEALEGARTVAAAGTADRERRRILAPLPELRAHGFAGWRILARAAAQSAVVGPLVLCCVLAAGGLELAAGRISAGELFAAGQYAALGAGLGGLTGVLGRLARSRAGTRRTGEVLSVAPLPYGHRRLPDGAGRLEFRGVVVRGVLNGVDLVVPEGACVAVVGRSGAGKSVLAALAARLRDPDEGVVLLDGVPLSEVDHDELRSAVGCAFARPALVGTTVGDAVGLGQPRRLVEAAARAAYADGFVQRLPHGYDTPLAQAPMSGGEVQRLGLARAWPAGRLLVLDDAMSSLDTVTEMQISRALLDRGAHRTRLIVTHRAATAARADHVVWLSAGRVAGTGPHSLLWNDPGYRAVFQ